MPSDEVPGGSRLAVRLRVGGRVQGVGFRYHVQQAARRCGAAGYVRNLPDGDVEVVAEGDSAALEMLVGAVRQGPPFGRVERMDRRDSPASGAFRGFEVRY